MKLESLDWKNKSELRTIAKCPTFGLIQVVFSLYDNKYYGLWNGERITRYYLNEFNCKKHIEIWRKKKIMASIEQ